MTEKLLTWILNLSTNEQTNKHLSHLIRKPKICICENKDADQLRSNCEADQRLCFRHTDSTIPLLSKSKLSSFYPSSEMVQTSFSHPPDKHIPLCACLRYFCLSTSTILAVSKCQSFLYLANRNVHLMLTST